MKVAFLGDQGLTSASVAALELVRREDADLAVLVGDFDYANRPAAWKGLLDRTLGASVPWLAVVGNHDTHSFAGPDGYEGLIRARLQAVDGLACSGLPGRRMSCTFRGLQLVLSDVGTLGERAQGERFVRESLAASNALWRVCAWHKNQRDLQVGSKWNEVGYGPYQACQSAGAFVVTGHEHSYARTRTLRDVGQRATDHGATGDGDALEVGPGQFFVVVSGAGGRSLRGFGRAHGDEPWWAAYYTANRELGAGVSREHDNRDNPAGVFFVTFGVDGDPRLARGVFKTAVVPRTIDEFTITAR